MPSSSARRPDRCAAVRCSRAMSYAFDPELAPVVAVLPKNDISDLTASRAGMAAMLEELNADVDTAGLSIEDHQVARPQGASPVPVRLYPPDGPAPAAGRPALLDIHG